MYQFFSVRFGVWHEKKNQWNYWMMNTTTQWSTTTRKRTSNMSTCQIVCLWNCRSGWSLTESIPLNNITHKHTNTIWSVQWNNQIIDFNLFSLKKESQIWKKNVRSMHMRRKSWTLDERGAAPETMSRTLPPVSCFNFEKMSLFQNGESPPQHENKQHSNQQIASVCVCVCLYVSLFPNWPIWYSNQTKSNDICTYHSLSEVEAWHCKHNWRENVSRDSPVLLSTRFYHKFDCTPEWKTRSGCK